MTAIDRDKIDKKELEYRQRLKDDFEFYARNCLKIRPKGGSLIDFQLNPAQRFLHAKIEQQHREKGFIRVIILKGRQQGCSSYIEGRLYWKVTHRRGVRAFILTHEEEATNNLFDMAKRYHDNCLPQLKPTIRTSNAKELLFADLDSGYKLGTAGNKSVGRSSTIQYLHASEVAFFKHADEHAKGIMQTVPREADTEIFIESTANGVGNWFHQQWLAAEAGQSDFIPVFLPWYWQPEYRLELPEDYELTSEEQELKSVYHLDDSQLMWRRIKIQELSVNGIDGHKSFMQEYPFTPSEAFQSSTDNVFIDGMLVAKARANNGHPIEPVGPKLLGVDPARFGDDRTAMIMRQGRVAYNLKTYIKIDTMTICGIVHNIILNDKPDKVFIDVGGLGAGVYDRLKELGHGDILIAVNSAEKALNEDRFSNKRAEMWALGKEWLLDGPVILPDSDELHGDLCNTRYRVDSKGRLLMESKEDMKKRGIRSSDCADSFLLTFAMPVSYFNVTSEKTLAKKASVVMHQSLVRKRNYNFT